MASGDDASLENALKILRHFESDAAAFFKIKRTGGNYL
jgi:hypothetical protein